MIRKVVDMVEFNLPEFSSSEYLTEDKQAPDFTRLLAEKEYRDNTLLLEVEVELDGL